MKNNELVPIETKAVPYMRPYHQEAKKASPSVILISIVLILVTAIICAAIFLPKEMKQTIFSFFAGETTSESTADGESTTESTKPAETTDLYKWDHALPEGATAIKAYDLSADAQGIFAENPTDAVLEMISPAFPKQSDGVSVIILNTHSFESYADGTLPYFTDASFASNGAEDDRIAAVCEALCENLNTLGIKAVFEDCKASSSFGSYQNARSILAGAMKKHPEAVLVIDLHRALMTDNKGALMRPVTAISDEITAQVRILLGTGAGFEQNTAAALSFFETANLTYPRLMMPISVSEGTLLQDAALPVLTLEVGSAGNSVAEAEYAASLIANVIADKMK